MGLGSAGQEKTGKKPPVRKPGTFLDPKEAGADFAIQGEYVGDGREGGKLGCQVIALGNGSFQAVLLPDGLPGAGWNGKDKSLLDGKLDGDKAVFTPATGKHRYMAGSPKEFSATATFPPAGQKDYTAEIYNEVMTVKTNEDKSVRLKKTVRHSPTEGARPPENAVVLFDGKSADEWREGKIQDGLLPVPANSKRSFKDFKLHVEFRTPFQPAARSQGRGNSGVYLHGRHEIQVLDSFGLDGKDNECGAFYGHKAPAVNMCFPPLTWQTYDVEWRTEPAGDKGKKEAAHATVFHNGVKVLDNIAFSAGQGPFHLQNHGNPVFYRNIWVVDLTQPESKK
jgi:hypothetical protein